MSAIRVSLRSSLDRSYSISFGPLGHKFIAELKRLGFSKGKIFLLTTQAVESAGHSKRLVSQLKKSGFNVVAVKIPNGEKHKTLNTLSTLYGAMVRHGIDRKSLVIALGGGVVTDLAGFLAASYMRGISFVSVPTTLLAMVDAAIGGKTGVDLPEGKNLVGAFWQPRLVWIDPALISTLPTLEWNTGFAEIIKYGVIRDRGFFAWLEQKIQKNPRVQHWNAADHLHVIHRSASIKAAVVSADEREAPLKGGREILNFGHTIGHALEAATVYAALSHGEAISIGMVAAGFLALSRGIWSMAQQERLINLLDQVNLPVNIPAELRINRLKFWLALRADKKNIDGFLRFVLPKKMGHVVLQSGISPKEVQNVLKSIGF